MSRRIYFDGAFYRESGEMFAALVSGEYKAIFQMDSHGKSADQAEWHSAVLALTYCRNQGFKSVKITGDSLNVIKAMRDGLEVRGDYAPALKKEIDSLLLDFDEVSWERVESKKNPAGALLRSLQSARKSDRLALARSGRNKRDNATIIDTILSKANRKNVPES